MIGQRPDANTGRQRAHEEEPFRGSEDRLVRWWAAALRAAPRSTSAAGRYDFPKLTWMMKSQLEPFQRSQTSISPESVPSVISQVRCSIDASIFEVLAPRTSVKNDGVPPLTCSKTLASVCPPL